MLSQSTFRSLSDQYNTPDSLSKSAASTTHHKPWNHITETTRQCVVERADQRPTTPHHPWSSFEPVPKIREGAGSQSPTSPITYTQRGDALSSPYHYDQDFIHRISFKAGPMAVVPHRETQTYDISSDKTKQPARSIGNKLHAESKPRSRTSPEFRTVTFDVPEKPYDLKADAHVPVSPRQSFGSTVMPPPALRSHSTTIDQHERIEHDEAGDIAQFQYQHPTDDIVRTPSLEIPVPTTLRLIKTVPLTLKGPPPLFDHRAVPEHQQRSGEQVPLPTPEFEFSLITQRYERLSFQEAQHFSSPISSLTSSLYSETLKANLEVSSIVHSHSLCHTLTSCLTSYT